MFPAPFCPVMAVTLPSGTDSDISSKITSLRILFESPAVFKTAGLSSNTEGAGRLLSLIHISADKGKIMMEDGKNYGDFLLETIDAAKDQFSADELKLLQGEAEKIREGLPHLLY